MNTEKQLTVVHHLVRCNNIFLFKDSACVINTFVVKSDRLIGSYIP